MARDSPQTYEASSPGHINADLLYKSLEQYNQEQKRSKRPSIILGSLICLFLSAAGGIALGVILLLQPLELQSACLARDLILFAAGMSLLYICLHIRAARRSYKRSGPGPPQIYGNYLHASALLIARLAVCVWIAALVVTIVLIAKSGPFEGFRGAVPFLNLVICFGALPSFILITITIEKHVTPFATTAISRNSFLTCRVSEFADDLTADLSVSRRASLQRKDGQAETLATLPTEDIFHLGASKLRGNRNKDTKAPVVITREIEIPDDRTELMANSPVRATHYLNPMRVPAPASPIPPVPKLPASFSKSPPQPTYSPGGWRNERNDAAEQTEMSRIRDWKPTDASTATSSSQYRSEYSSESGPSSRTSDSSRPKINRYHGRASTSMAGSKTRPSLANVQYASEPADIRKATKLVKRPLYTPAIRVDRNGQNEAIKPPKPVAILRGAQNAQKTNNPTLKRKTSNFSRPITPKGSEADSGVDVKIPGAFVDDLMRA